MSLTDKISDIQCQGYIIRKLVRFKYKACYILSIDIFKGTDFIYSYVVKIHSEFTQMHLKIILQLPIPCSEYKLPNIYTLFDGFTDNTRGYLRVA